MRFRLVGCVLAVLATPASAVGLGPLVKVGATDGPAKAFYLELRNPYDHAETFTSVAIASGSETPAARVIIFPAKATLAPRGQRRLLVVADQLVPGETFTFRVCAYRPPKPSETVYARVCSKLTARRIAAQR